MALSARDNLTRTDSELTGEGNGPLGRRTLACNVVALDLGLDLHSSNGELVANVLGSVAQWERKRRGEAWEAARRNAMDAGS